MKVKGYGTTNIGQRSENQDAYVCECYESPRGCIYALAAVCDGMGGHQGGQTASRIAMDTIKDTLHTPPKHEDEVKTWLNQLIQIIQENLDKTSQSNPELSEMGTTLVMGVVSTTKIWIVNIGDSRAYRIDHEGAEQITHDHSALQEALDQGIYTKEEIHENAQLRRMSSAITRCLGRQSNYEADIYEFSKQDDQWILLCSDGLTGNVTDIIVSKYEIKKNFQGTDDIKKAAQNLMSLAYQNGSTDNITIVILEIGSPQRSEQIVSLLPHIDQLRKKEEGELYLPLKKHTLWQPIILIAIIAAFSLLMVLVYKLVLSYYEYDSKATETYISSPTPFQENTPAQNTITPGNLSAPLSPSEKNPKHIENEGTKKISEKEQPSSHSIDPVS